MSGAFNPDALDASITAAPGGVHLAILVIPRAPRTEIAGTRKGRVLVRLTAPPVEGAANDALTKFLARVFGVPRRAVILLSGQHSREKRVLIEGISPTDARKILKSMSA